MNIKIGVLLPLYLLIGLCAFPLFASTPSLEGDGICMSCHEKEGSEASVGKKGVPGYVSRKSIEESVHRGAKCTSCHEDVNEWPHLKKPERVDCGICHGDEKKSYLESVHGIAAQKGEEDVPRCTTCHGGHHILPANDPGSLSFSLNIVDVCLGCHEDEKLDIEHDMQGARYIKAYRESVHGKAIVRAGLNVAAVCPDCHGNHKILPADRPDSKVSKLQIPADCGKCHPGIMEEYEKSVHARGLRAGIADSPVCTDCHGEHTISKITDPSSKVYKRNIPGTCGACHESEVISSRYAIPKKRFSTYMESFHGIALEYGMTKAANCSSCHGYHGILPAADPNSPINKSNIPDTCGKCHPGTSKNFAKGKIHMVVSRDGNVGAWMVRVFYTGFISILMILFLLHISFDVVERMRRRKGEGKAGGNE